MTTQNGRYWDENGEEYRVVDGERLYLNRMRDFTPAPVPQPVEWRDGRKHVLGLVATAEEPDIEIETFEVYDTPEILEFEVPEVESLPVLGRQGLIMAGGTNLLYSYPKTGKTELLTALTKEWVAGMRVLYLTEEPMPNWKRRLTEHGFTPADFTLRMAYTWGFRIDKVCRLIESETFDVLVVDTLRNTVGFSESDGDKDVQRVMVPLFRAAAGRTVICSYHARKMPGEGGRDISGHHSLYGAFDRAVQLAPVEGKETHRRLTVSGRCMYEGDVTVEYRQTAPCRFEVLDTITLVEHAAGPRTYDRQCLDCGDWFEASRSDSRFCSDACRKHTKRKQNISTESEDSVRVRPRSPRGTRTSADTPDTAEGELL